MLVKRGSFTLIPNSITHTPNHFLPLFPIHLGVVQKIEMVSRSFLWGDEVEGSKKNTLGEEG